MEQLKIKFIGRDVAKTALVNKLIDVLPHDTDVIVSGQDIIIDVSDLPSIVIAKRAIADTVYNRALDMLPTASGYVVSEPNHLESLNEIVLQLEHQHKCVANAHGIVLESTNIGAYYILTNDAIALARKVKHDVYATGKLIPLVGYNLELLNELLDTTITQTIINRAGTFDVPVRL